jgi:hypothetical protein
MGRYVLFEQYLVAPASSQCILNLRLPDFPSSAATTGRPIKLLYFQVGRALPAVVAKGF